MEKIKLLSWQFSLPFIFLIKIFATTVSVNVAIVDGLRAHFPNYFLYIFAYTVRDLFWYKN
jgi:hypothetical protein